MTYEECKKRFSNSHKILCDDGDYLVMYKIYGNEYNGKELELVKFNNDEDSEPCIIMIVEEEVERLKKELITKK
jgi:hypothetical protein